MTKSFLGKKILISTAHPDDESYAAAGSIYKNHQVGGKNFLICASFGEKGSSHLKKPVSENQLKKIRFRELKKSGKIIHLKKILVLGLPDGRIKKHAAEIYDQSLLLAQKIKPDAILSFGPDGISGHWDHVTMGRIAKKIAQKLNLPIFTFALSPKITSGASKWLKNRRQANWYLKKFLSKNQVSKSSSIAKLKSGRLKATLRKWIIKMLLLAFRLSRLMNY